MDKPPINNSLAIIMRIEFVWYNPVVEEDPGTHKFKLNELKESTQPPDQDLFSKDEIDSLADLLSGNSQEPGNSLDDTGKFLLEK